MRMSVARRVQVAGPREYSLVRMVLYFLKLGTIGFGGPIALAAYMQRDLGDERKWLTHDEYLEGLALAQLAPGPLAAQLAMYLGFIRAGWLGATLVGFAFIGPSFVMVVLLALAYVRYGGLAWMQAVFYGVGAVVIGIIARSAWKLMKSTLKKDNHRARNRVAVHRRGPDLSGRKSVSAEASRLSCPRSSNGC